MGIEHWMQEHTFKCAIGRVSAQQCRVLRERPVFDPHHFCEGPYRPKQCMECKEWEDNMTHVIEQQEHEKKEKKCSCCGQVKPLEEFYKDKKSPDGHKYTCKECQSKSKAKKAAANIDPLRCSLCGRPLDWYDKKQGIGFVTEHYILSGATCCIVCFSKIYGMRGFGDLTGRQDALSILQQGV